MLKSHFLLNPRTLRLCVWLMKSDLIFFLIGWLINEKTGCSYLSVPIYDSLRYKSWLFKLAFAILKIIFTLSIQCNVVLSFRLQRWTVLMWQSSRLTTRLVWNLQKVQNCILLCLQCLNNMSCECFMNLFCASWRPFEKGLL